jgi:ABC-type multidrug transport system fused ATPase/permease subunit
MDTAVPNLQVLTKLADSVPALVVVLLILVVFVAAGRAMFRHGLEALRKVQEEAAAERRAAADERVQAQTVFLEHLDERDKADREDRKETRDVLDRNTTALGENTKVMERAANIIDGYRLERAGKQ